MEIRKLPIGQGLAWFKQSIDLGGHNPRGVFGAAALVLLARSAHDACQAFRWGDRAWGVQFHPEFSATHMRGYVDARRDALLAEGRDPRALSRTITATPRARGLLRRFVAVARTG